MRNTSEKVEACEDLATVFEESDGRVGVVKDAYEIACAHDAIAYFFNKASWEVSLQDGWKMVDFLLDRAQLLTDVAEVIKEHLPTRIEGDD